MAYVAHTLLQYTAPVGFSSIYIHIVRIDYFNGLLSYHQHGDIRSVKISTDTTTTVQVFIQETAMGLGALCQTMDTHRDIMHSGPLRFSNKSLYSVRSACLLLRQLHLMLHTSEAIYPV